MSPRRVVLAGDREDVDPVAGEGEALLGPGHSSRVEVPVWQRCSVKCQELGEEMGLSTSLCSFGF